jgi:dsRNA-specific ribonuclease
VTTDRQTPPPRLRAKVTAHERALITDAVGPLAAELLLRAVRDGRGREFQRLELLGDSVLDLLLAVHRWVVADCPACGGTSQVASDRHLAQAARDVGLGSWLEWDASDDRIADLVEACVAAAWLSGGWEQAVGFVSRVVHPLGVATAPVLSAGGASAAPGREARRVGAALLELAAAAGLYRQLPLADEGELSTRRARIHHGERIAAAARASDPGLRGDTDTVVSKVEDTLAALLASAGADQALAAARPLLGFTQR